MGRRTHTPDAFDHLAESLVNPAETGVYLAKSEMIVLANLTEGSLRVNERRRMLADVLKSPETLAGLSDLLEHIVVHCRAHVERYTELGQAWPAMAPTMAPWASKAQATIKRLRDLQAELAEEAELAAEGTGP
ncbi:MAG: hypothetical protein KC613_01445 [Myxococcales bacterium]|nr:hypothetical protein [Myxococcales bacterium]MCB9524240.1 hypothetical protein [Myxococcales bacterium]